MIYYKGYINDFQPVGMDQVHMQINRIIRIGRRQWLLRSLQTTDVEMVGGGGGTQRHTGFAFAPQMIQTNGLTFRRLVQIGLPA
mgnify:CR=1 FL=1